MFCSEAKAKEHYEDENLNVGVDDLTRFCSVNMH